jgi:hypothetical protein
MALKKVFLKTNPANAADELLKVAKILMRLRASSKHWQEHFGSDNKLIMLNWEREADNWISENTLIIDNEKTT